MKLFLRQFKQLILTILLVHCAVAVIAQSKATKPATLHNKYTDKKIVSDQLKNFYHLLSDANIVFKFPEGYKEIPVLDNEDYSFDYAMEIPGREFEIWFQVKPQKGDYATYERLRNVKDQQLESPDSSYIRIGQAQATAFSGDQHYYMRNISSDILVRYSANAGKSYLLTLPDQPETKHFKYALLLTLERDHIGTILAICFTNEKNPEFFKNINRISKYIKFKTS